MKYFVSLGSDCSVALYLRDRGLREQAFPFDWGVSPMGSVLHLIENDFRGFMDDDDILFLPPASRKTVIDDNNEGQMIDDVITPCFLKSLRVLLPHDFSEVGADELTQVRNKYYKRINRFIELLHDENNSFVFVANDAPTNPTGWRSQQYLLASNQLFINDNHNWKDRLNQIMNTKYPSLTYETYNLKELKNATTI